MYASNQPMHGQQYQYPPPPPSHPAPPAQPPPASGGVDFFGGVAAPPPPPPTHQMQRTYSNHSHATSLGNHSASGQNAQVPPILNDTTIAPPPPKPHVLNSPQFSQYQNSSGGSVPNFDLVKHSGDILARLSLKSMLTKKWRQAYWIAYGYHQILFFRSRADFEQWIANPFLSPEARDELIKFNIDFKNHVQYDGALGYKVSTVATKEYRSDGYMYQCKIDKWYSYGPSVSAAVGSKNEMQVRNLRSIMAAMIDLNPQNVPADNDIDDGSMYGSSAASRFSSGSLHSSHLQNGGNAKPYLYDLGAKGPEQNLQAYKNNHSSHSQEQREQISRQHYAYDLGAPASALAPQRPHQSLYAKYLNKDDDQGKKKSWGKNLFSRKKKEEPQEVQYYVGRPSNNKRYELRPSEVNYGM